MKFNPNASAKPTARPAGSPPAASGRLQTAATRPYVGGYSDPAIEDFGVEDGEAALNDPSTWGEENSRPTSIEVFDDAHETQTHLVGDAMRADVQTIATDIVQKVPLHSTAAANATTASDESTSAQIRRLALEGKLVKLGLATPDQLAFLKSAGILLALFIGDWALIAVSFQTLGLSDQPWLPGFAVTDDLHLAALASVVTLVILAHGTGSKLRHLAHGARLRRRITDVEEREKLPRVSVLDIVLASIFFGFAAAAVIGIGVVRIDYLLTSGLPVSAAPFLLIQAAVLVAAVVVAYEFTHPLGREWKSSTAAVTKSGKHVQHCIDALDRSTGSLNADIELLDATVARAGHHVGADESNTIRQSWLYVRRATLSQPETTTEVLFPEQLPAPAHLEGDELLEELTGITSLPKFVRVTTEAFHKHHAENQAAVRAVAALLERVELSDAFDADDVAGLEIARPVAPLVAVAKTDEEDAA